MSKRGSEAKEVQDCLVWGPDTGVSEDTNYLVCDVMSGE
jgi:hypothetical protein